MTNSQYSRCSFCGKRLNVLQLVQYCGRYELCSRCYGNVLRKGRKRLRVQTEDAGQEAGG